MSNVRRMILNCACCIALVSWIPAAFGGAVICIGGFCALAKGDVSPGQLPGLVFGVSILSFLMLSLWHCQSRILLSLLLCFGLTTIIGSAFTIERSIAAISRVQGDCGLPAMAHLFWMSVCYSTYAAVPSLMATRLPECRSAFA